MVKKADYDTLAESQPSKQRQIKAIVEIAKNDIRRIDKALIQGGESELKSLHMELDGTYQPLIENWTNGTYNHMDGCGYIYEIIDESSLHDNLIIMKGKIRGLLLKLSPDEAVTCLASISSSNIDQTNDSKEAPTNSSPVRTNMYDIIKGRKFDVVKEYARIWNLFNCSDSLGQGAMSLAEDISSSLQFFPDTFSGRALELDDFNDIYNFQFNPPNKFVTEEELISYCEYVITLCNHLKEYASWSIDHESEYLLEELYKTVESCMDELGLMPAKRDNITIFVNKDPTVTIVAEIVDDSLSYDVKSYIHKQTKGNLKRKKTILKFLADDIELQRKNLNGVNKTLSDNLFQMLQKFVRHNNEDNLYIKSLSPEEIEECYDDIYQMWLLAKLEIDNLERKKRVEDTLKQINAKN